MIILGLPSIAQPLRKKPYVDTLFSNIYNSLTGKHLLLTGGTGFFGRWILAFIKELNALGANTKVTIVSRNPMFFLRKYPEFKGLTWLYWQDSDVRSLHDFTHQKIDFILHAAADVSAQTSPMELFDTIAIGSRRIFDLAVKYKVKRVLLTGSGAQYGVLPFGIPVSEKYTGACISNSVKSVYAEAKRYQETLATLYSAQYGLDVVMTRCFAFSGAGLPLDGHFAIGNFVRDALFCDEIVIQSTGESVRSYMHGSDLAIWLLTLLLKGESGEAYNVGSSEAISIKDLAQRVLIRLAPDKKIHIVGHKEGVERSYYVPDITKACRLGLDIWTSLDESIDDMAAWAKNNSACDAMHSK